MLYDIYIYTHVTIPSASTKIVANSNYKHILFKNMNIDTMGKKKLNSHEILFITVLFF